MQEHSGKNILQQLLSLPTVVTEDILLLIEEEINRAYDKERALREIEEQLCRLPGIVNNILINYKLKFIAVELKYGSEKLTVKEIAQEYKKTPKTVLSWIKEKGLKAELVIDDYYVCRKDLVKWIEMKAWKS